MEHLLDLEILPQPDDTTCGPTCLQAVYKYYGDPVALARVIDEVPALEEGGTMAVYLACHALRRGYKAQIYTYNLRLFDPTWFGRRGVDLSKLLREQLKYKSNRKVRLATQAYLEFFELGGKLRFRELTAGLLRGHLKKQSPILCGLSSTYLYQCAREHNDEFDDLRGEPVGHFVVLGGYDRVRRKIHVWDPLQDNPRFGGQRYEVSVGRVLGAILMAAVTQDADLLIIEPASDRPPARPGEPQDARPTT